VRIYVPYGTHWYPTHVAWQSSIQPVLLPARWRETDTADCDCIPSPGGVPQVGVTAWAFSAPESAKWVKRQVSDGSIQSGQSAIQNRQLLWGFMSDKPLQGMWALILGASSGFGGATARLRPPYEYRWRSPGLWSMLLAAKAVIADIEAAGAAPFFNTNAADPTVELC
jgi:hypothetical protein